MLFWHKHNVDKALSDLPNFTPFPDEWTVEDKVLFEQAFSFHGKSFHRIRQMVCHCKVLFLFPIKQNSFVQQKLCYPRYILLPRYNWNIVESGDKHHNNKNMSIENLWNDKTIRKNMLRVETCGKV